MIYFSLLVISILLLLQVFGRKIFKKNAGRILIWSTVLMFSISFIYSVAQVYYMMLDTTAKYMVPPYYSINYVAFSTFMKYFLPYIISLTVALLFIFSAKVANKKSGERFFEKEEIAIASTAIFLSGYPGVLVYFVALIGFYSLVHIVNLITKRRKEPVPLYYFWLPTAIFAIIIIEVLLKALSFWMKIII